MDVAELIRSRNRYLLIFLNHSKEFLSSLEHRELASLASMDKKRDSLLRGIDLLNRKIAAELLCVPEPKRASLAEFIHLAAQEASDTIQSIMNLDQQLILQLQTLQKELSDEVNTSEKNSQTFKKFKSHWVNESGQTLDAHYE